MAYAPISGLGGTTATAPKTIGYTPIQGLGTAPTSPATPVSAPKAPSSSSIPANALKGSLGGGYGTATDKDSSGKNLMTFENQATQSSQLMTDRTAPTFNPTIAQKLDKNTFSNSGGRIPLSISSKIKDSMGGVYSDELDHKIALELGGSNSINNLQIQAGRLNGGVSAQNDLLENALAKKVSNGELSLIDAQQQLAKAKGYSLPEFGGGTAQPGNPMTGYSDAKKGGYTPIQGLETAPTGTTPPKQQAPQTDQQKANDAFYASTGLTPSKIGMPIGNETTKAPFNLNDKVNEILTPILDLVGHSVDAQHPLSPINLPLAASGAVFNDATQGIIKGLVGMEVGTEKQLNDLVLPLMVSLSIAGPAEISSATEALKTKITDVVKTHIDSVTSDLISKGYTPAEAHSLALRGGFVGELPNKPVPPELQSLAEEAKKYKSAEEFVKAQTPVYHGTTEKFSKFSDKKGYGGTAWFSDNKAAVEANNVEATRPPGSGWNVMERYVNPEIKLVDRSTVEGRKLDDSMMKDQLRSMGYGGVKHEADATRGSYIELFNPSKDAWTKKQLTDFYNQATKATSVIQPLAQEAQKYKTAEEFVKAQGNVIYRATDSKSGYAELGNGIYGADTPEMARLFGKNIEQIIIDPKANIIKEGSPEYESLARAVTPRNDYKMNPELARKTALARGIDGIKGIDPDTGTVIFNDKIIKTKSQLTDFYNQATKGITDKVLAPQNRTPTLAEGVPATKSETNIPKPQPTTERSLSEKPPGTSSALPRTIQETKNKVNLTVRGATEKERVQSAIVNSERIKNEITIRGKDALAEGQKLSASDIKLAEQYEQGTPVKDLAAKSKNPAQFTKFMDNLTSYYDFRLAADRAVGGHTARVENYLPHRWDLSKPEDLAYFNEIARQRGIAPYNGFSAQPRVFNSYAEGETLGFKRSNPTILGDLKGDYGGASNIISKHALARGLQEAAPEKVSGSGYGKTDTGKPFVNSNIPGMEGLSYHPDIHEQLKGFQPLANKDVFSVMKEKGFNVSDPKTYGKAWEGLKDAGFLNTVGTLYDRVNRPMKHFLLNFSGFHSINISANFTGASIFNPIKGPLGLAESIPSFFSEKLTGKIVDGFKSKIVSGQDFSVFDAGLRAGVNMDRGLPATGITQRLNPFSILQRAMFDRELHILKLNLVDQVFSSGKVLPDSPQGIALGKEINMIMGEVNNRTMNIDPNVQKWASRVLLAPQFTESKYALIVKSLSSNPTKSIALKAVVGKSIAIGTLATLGTLLATGKFPNLQQTLLNYTISPTTQTNIKNPKGQVQDITYPQTFISEPGKPIAGLLQGDTTALTHYGEARLAPALSTGIKAYSNQDYYGQPIINPASPDSTASQYAKNIGQGLLPIGAQAYLNYKEGKFTGLQAVINIGGLQTKLSASDPGFNSPATLRVADMIFTQRPKFETQIKQLYLSGRPDDAMKIMVSYNQKLLADTIQSYKDHGYKITDLQALTTFLVDTTRANGGLKDAFLKPPSDKVMENAKAKQGKPLFNKIFSNGVTQPKP